MNKKQISPDMRRIHFSLRERLVVTPLELIPALKYFPVVLLLFLIRKLILHESWATSFLIDSLGLLGAIITGSILMPILLPWIPGRAFSFKGAFLGLFFASIWSWTTHADLITWITNGLLYFAVSAYLALNFTGTSTFTSMSGVYKEMRLSLPWILPSALIGLVLMWF